MRVVDKKTLFQNPYVEVKKVVFEPPAERTLVEVKDAVAVICLENNELVLVKQHRFICHSDILEIPAGKIDGDESALSAAKRELREETGYDADKWRFIGKFYPTPGVFSEQIYLFLAEDLNFVGQHLDPEENIEVVRLPIKSLTVPWIMSNIVDMKTALALFYVMFNTPTVFYSSKNKD